MEKIISYILSNITNIAVFLALLGGAYRYFDIREREEKRLKYENYLNVIKLFSKFAEKNLHVFELVCSIYQLQHFKEKEYKSNTIPVLSFMKERFLIIENENITDKFAKTDLKNIISAIDYVSQELGANKTLKQVQGDVKEKERQECKQ